MSEVSSLESSSSSSCSCGKGQGCGCASCKGKEDGAQKAFVYALGNIAPRIPSPGIEKELAQVVGRSNATGMTDRQSLHAVISHRENRYLARRLCWVFSVEQVETYILVPQEPSDLDLLLGSLRPDPKPTDLDVVIGVRGPVAPPTACNGLQLPLVAVHQLYSFDRQALIDSIPRDKSSKSFAASAEEVLDRILQAGGNTGASDEHRALNYLVMRCPAIYARVFEAHASNSTLSDVTVRRSALSGARRIVEVIFSFTHRSTDTTDKSVVRVDVTEEFPFLVSKLSPYFDR